MHLKSTYFSLLIFHISGSGCVAQLVERLLLILEVRSLNPVIGKIYLYLTFVYCQLIVEKTKIKKKRPGMVHFFKKVCFACFKAFRFFNKNNKSYFLKLVQRKFTLRNVNSFHCSGHSCEFFITTRVIQYFQTKD